MSERIDEIVKVSYSSLCSLRDNLQDVHNVQAGGAADSQQETVEPSHLAERLAAIRDIVAEIETLVVPTSQTVAVDDVEKEKSAPPASIENLDPQTALAETDGAAEEEQHEEKAEDMDHDANPVISREKLVEVPVRKRTGRAATDTTDPSQPTAAPTFRTFTLTLPATPFAPHVPVDVYPGAPHPTPVTVDAAGRPTTTPVAADILATLGLMSSGMGEQQQAPNTQATLMFQNTGGYYSGNVQFTNHILPSMEDPEVGDRKPCNCKRSQCLKLYCDCFSAGGFCTSSCTCVTCCNTEQDLRLVQQARKQIMSKDPLAFRAKVTAVTGHKRGCKCKRSKCLKKYCECFSAGARCNPDVCSCEGCKNLDFSAGPSRDTPGMYTGITYVLPHQQSVMMPSPVYMADPNSSSMEPPAAFQPQQQQQVEQQLGAVLVGSTVAAAAAVDYNNAAVPTPNTDGTNSEAGNEEASPADSEPASALVSHLSGDNDDDDNDVASSPAPQPFKPLLGAAGRMGTMTAAAKRPVPRPPLPHAAAKFAELNGILPAATMSAGAINGSGGVGARRPKRAASGGVLGAVAAEAANWGAEFISPPLKRSHHAPVSHTTAIAAATAAGHTFTSPGPQTLRRNAMLRDALHNVNTGVTPVKGPEENEAASALVDLIAAFQ